MADIGLSAFSLFFMQSESFLSHRKRLFEGHGTSNCQTLFGMEKIPTDNHIRTLPDAVSQGNRMNDILMTISPFAPPLRG